MAQIDVKIEMAEPFLVGDRKPATVTETLTYLPGSVLRGVVAEALLRDWLEESRRLPHPDRCPDRGKCAFCQLFYPHNGSLPCFGNLYPTSGDAAYPFPTTARTCKHHPGFRRDDFDPDERHGIFDTLIRQHVFEKALESRKPLPFIYLPECPRCRAKAEPVPSPFYSMLGDRYQATQIFRRRLSRTAISRRRGAAQEKQLFTLNVLSEQMDTDFLDEDGVSIKEITTLRGRIWVSDDNVEAMQSALQQVERIGAVRSRGMGRIARIEATPVIAVKDKSAMALFLEQIVTGKFALPERLQEQDSTGEPLCLESLAERVIAFNVRFQAEQSFYAKLGAPISDDCWYFTVNLLSDTILTDDGLPTLRLTPEMSGLVGNGLPKVELERPFVGRAYRSGWSGAHGLPRQMYLAVPMGGVYLYRVETAGQEETGRLLEKLEKLEQDGLGLDRERGCGQVMVCLPFHLEVEPR
jgi:CRISPR-associated protein Csx10